MGTTGLPEDFPRPSPAAAPAPDLGDFEERLEHRYVENGLDGTSIHYAAAGEGPLVVMLHGFPDYWYTWRHQMAALAGDYRVAAADLRGYNLSGKPEGIEGYGMKLLLGDVAAVIEGEAREDAVVVGHDWGGAIAWQFAARFPQMTRRLAVLNLPHLSGLTRELAENPEQRRASAYTRYFQEEDAHEALDAERLGRWVSDPAARQKYVAAFERSDFEAMLFYYKRHYPREPYRALGPPESRVQAPVLLVHGLEDPYLFPAALNGTWEWVDGELTLVTVPGAGHFVQQDAADLVSRTLGSWLSR